MAESIILAGNPNVGKSTVFNALTGMRQHTGNWPGKTVESAHGSFEYRGEKYNIVDLPGTYSFSPDSEDERIAGEYIGNHSGCITVIVCDATALERSLILALQTMDLCGRTVICVNLLDEAKRRGISIDLDALGQRLGVPVFGTDIKDRKKKQKLLGAIKEIKAKQPRGFVSDEKFDYIEKAEAVCHGIITLKRSDTDYADRKIDRILLGRYTAVPCMAALLALIFYITLVFSSYPSDFLYSLSGRMLAYLKSSYFFTSLPPAVSSIIIDGMLKVVCWVVAVMLPPMAIFFPLFTLLEDSGYLPRAAFYLDEPFRRCGTCGKQALTMCMGLGCNCTGITGCRIISSEKEKLIAAATNSFIPCNGRFPMLTAVITMFFAGFGKAGRLAAAAVFVSVIMLSVGMTFLVSRILSKTVIKEKSPAFIMELPPYRKPDTLRVIVRSLFDRTFFVLGRAVCTAAPAGVIIWLLSHTDAGGCSLFQRITLALDPVGRLMGLDGTILTGFILGLPANEIVIPIIIMGYLSQSSLESCTNLSELMNIFTQNGWTVFTAVSMIIFTVFHWPCSTAVITVKKETGSKKWTAAAVVLPAVTGFILCFLFNMIAKFVQFVF